MTTEDFLIGILFIFCLALLVGGSLMLFRKGKVSGRDYLQYFVIPIYTFGFYSLWSQEILSRIPGIPNNEFIQQLLSVMGLPFLITGLYLQLGWAIKIRGLSGYSRLISFLAPIVGLLLTIVIFEMNQDILMAIHQWTTVLSVSLLFTTTIILFSGSSEFIEAKWKNLLTAILLLSALFYLLPLSGFRDHFMFLSMYCFGIFLFATVVQSIFLFTAESPKKPVSGDFEEFLEKFRITPRESEIALGIFEGKSNQEIADAQFVTLQTVKDHTSRIYQKTEVKSRSQLIALLRDYIS